MKLNKLLLALAATLCAASTQASVVAFVAAPGSNVTQGTDLYWNMLSNATSTSSMGAVGNFQLSGHGDIHYNAFTADFVNNGTDTGGVNLAAGSLIDSASNWDNNFGYVGTTDYMGGCALGQTCLYGLSFIMAGNTHYGWVRFQEIDMDRQQLLAWGYQDIADTGIGAGDTADRVVPEPVSVALLGIGLAGLALSRRKLAARKA